MHTILRMKSSGYSEYGFDGVRSFIRRTVSWGEIPWC
jgi:hypothetical protein